MSEPFDYFPMRWAWLCACLNKWKSARVSAEQLEIEFATVQDAHDVLASLDAIRDGRQPPVAPAVAALTAERDALKVNLADTEATVERLRAHLERVIGEHIAPGDCYSTGPQFGDARDFTCPSCDARADLAPRAEGEACDE